MRRGPVDPLAHLRIGDERESETLEDVAHPGRPRGEAQRESVSGLVVGCHDREAHVRSEELRHRADAGPPLLGVPDDRAEGSAREQREVVVLDDQHVGVVREHRPKLRSAFLGEARAGGVVRARRADHRPDAVGQRGPQPLDGHALGVHRHRHRAVAALTDGVQRREEAGVFEGDGVVALQRLGQQSLDRVARAAGHGDAGSTVGQPLGHPFACPRLQPRVDDGFAVQHGTTRPREGRGGVGDERRVGVAGADVAQHGPGRIPLLRHGSETCDAGAAPPARDDESGLGEQAVGGDDGVAVHAEIGGEGAHGGECIARPQLSALDALPQVRGDLGCRAPGDVDGHAPPLAPSSLCPASCYGLA